MEHVVLNDVQKDVLALPPIGHHVILGTAGSGKTTMALLRAVGLSNLPQSGRVLLVTFNRALVQYMAQMLGSSSSNIKIEIFHKFARGYLSHRGKMPEGKAIVENDEKIKLIEKAIQELKKEFPNESTYRRPVMAFVDEIVFMERFGINNMDEYIEIKRIGRAAVNIKRENRKWFYKVYELYLKYRLEAGFMYDWDDIALYVYRELMQDNSPRLYTHIIVDEGQDFSPMMLKSLVKAIPSDGSFTFFGDVAQQIYGSRMSWRDSGIEIRGNKIWKFDRNYRNPRTIAEFARDITKSEFWSTDDDMVISQDVLADGPKPVLISFSSKENEMNWLIGQIKKNMNKSSVVVILRNRSMVEYVKTKLKYNSIIAIEIKKDIGFALENNVYVSTFHSVKGLEFENVYIPLLDDDIFPDWEMIGKSIDQERAISDELKLLYVAVTRSQYAVFMSYNNKLSRLFPINAKSYDGYREKDVM